MDERCSRHFVCVLHFQHILSIYHSYSFMCNNRLNGFALMFQRYSLDELHRAAPMTKWSMRTAMRRQSFHCDYQIMACCLVPSRSTHMYDQAPLYWNGWTLISVWINNHKPWKLWNEITYPFPNLNGAIVEAWDWISCFISHVIMDMIICPCWIKVICKNSRRTVWCMKVIVHKMGLSTKKETESVSMACLLGWRFTVSLATRLYV